MDSRPGLPLIPRTEWPSDRTYMNDSSTSTNKDLHDYLMTSDQHSPVEKKGIFSSLGSLIWSEPTPPIEVKPSTVRYEETFAALRALLSKNSAYLDYKSKNPSTDIPYLKNIAQLPDENMGVFATADIPKGTLICRTDYVNPGTTVKYDLKINDLAYYDFMPNYEYMDINNIKRHINIRGINVQGVIYLQAIKDIKKGEEISRLYGYDYWFKDIKEIHDWNAPFDTEQSPHLDETKATVLKKIIQFVAKQKDNMRPHELENQIVKMLQNKDSDW